MSKRPKFRFAVHADSKKGANRICNNVDEAIKFFKKVNKNFRTKPNSPCVIVTHVASGLRFVTPFVEDLELQRTGLLK